MSFTEALGFIILIIAGAALVHHAAVVRMSRARARSRDNHPAGRGL